MYQAHADLNRAVEAVCRRCVVPPHRQDEGRGQRPEDQQDRVQPPPPVLMVSALKVLIGKPWCEYVAELTQRTAKVFQRKLGRKGHQILRAGAEGARGGGGARGGARRPLGGRLTWDLDRRHARDYLRPVRVLQGNRGRGASGLCATMVKDWLDVRCCDGLRGWFSGLPRRAWHRLPARCGWV